MSRTSAYRFRRARFSRSLDRAGRESRRSFDCLIGCTSLLSGTVLLKALDFRSIAPQELRRRIGMVMQTAYLFPGTVSANIAFGPKRRGEILAPDRIALLLHRVGLPGFADRHVSNLSGGEAQRVALAQRGRSRTSLRYYCSTSRPPRWTRHRCAASKLSFSALQWGRVSRRAYSNGYNVPYGSFAAPHYFVKPVVRGCHFPPDLGR